MARPDHTAFMALSIEQQAEELKALQALHQEKKENRAVELRRELQALGLSEHPTNLPKSGDGRAAPKPKYRSARNPSQTWAGRGAKPKWLVAEMEELGKDLDQFRV